MISNNLVVTDNFSGNIELTCLCHRFQEKKTGLEY